MIGQSLIDLVRTLSVAQVIRGTGTELTPQGKELVGLCPLHGDTRPSLSVHDAKGVWRCWSCQASGDAIRWVELLHQLRFPEAVQWLARQYGIVDHPMTKDEIRAEREHRHIERAGKRWARGVKQTEWQHNITLLDALELEIRRLKGLAHRDRSMEGPIWDALARAYHERDRLRARADSMYPDEPGIWPA